MKTTYFFSFLLIICVATNSAASPTAQKKLEKRIKNTILWLVTDTITTATPTAKVFGGGGQYNTWSLGINIGITSPMLATGGSNDFAGYTPSLGYGMAIKKQLAHSFGLQFELNSGTVKGTNLGNSVIDVTGGLPISSFSTSYWQGAITSNINVFNVNYLHRKNVMNLYITTGFGLITYQPTIITSSGAVIIYKNKDDLSNKHVTNLYLPIGAGIKFKLTEATSLNFGYTENFIDDDNFDGTKHGYPTKDHYSYSYGGLEYTLGPKSKQSLAWVNPVAIMYDELYDEALGKELAALKIRVANIEKTVKDLKKDSDGDGVQDQFDKCPNTPFGTVVDGSGCAIVFPKINNLQ